MRSVERRFSRLRLCDDGILEAHPLRREHPRTATLLSETLEAMLAVADGQPRPVLWDPAGTLPLPPLGWQAIIEGVRGLFQALAIVVDSEEEHLLGAFPKTMDSLLVPVRVFRTESAAHAWLLQFVDPTTTAADRAFNRANLCRSSASQNSNGLALDHGADCRPLLEPCHAELQRTRSASPRLPSPRYERPRSPRFFKNSDRVSMTQGGSFDVDGKEAELVELRELASAPDLWNDQDRAKEVTQKLARFEGIIAKVDTLKGRIDDAEVLFEMAAEESDAETAAEASAELAELDGKLTLLERESLFFGEYDDRPAILSVHAGAGGVDAQDWAEILLRMYVRYLERTPFKVEIDEIQPGDEAGIKSATLTIKGDHAYGSFESERGVHRLVRISPFDSAARRHTSFAGVDVIPEVDATEIEISQDDLRIDTYRSQGAGGQHVNTSDSAVRITHIPTGVVVACQNERSQLQNKNRAMQLLVARLAEVSRQNHLNEIDSIRGEQTEAGWGRQIRSYVMQPYQMVKDLRTDLEVGNINGVLDGDIDDFIDSYLHWRRAEKEE